MRVEQTQKSLRHRVTSPAEGPPPAWSVPLRRLDQELGEIGPVILVPDTRELRAGRTVWKGAAVGVPIDGDNQSVLVRGNAEAGELALLDLSTGVTRWTAPDPLLSGASASWRSAVTEGLVAVSAAEDDRPIVLVYEARTGRQLGRYPGWLAGAGADWVAVSHTGPGGLAVDLRAF